MMYWFCSSDVLQDALTDMYISMEDISVDDDDFKNLVTKVHTESILWNKVIMNHGSGP